jgi:hypothetical protein
MKRLLIEQSDDEIYTSHSGLALAGPCINEFSDLSRVNGRTIDKQGNVISTVIRCAAILAYPALARVAMRPLTGMRDDSYFKDSLGIKKVPLPNDFASGSTRMSITT